MDEVRSDLVATLNEAADASGAARKVMVHVEQALRSGAAEVAGGGDILEALRTSRIHELRSELNAAMENVAATRHRFRLALASICAANGMNAREVSELWGFSRQRAQTLIQEARDYTPREQEIEAITA